MKLTTKETQLLSDLKGQEELCIEKYGKYADQASDSQLTDLFRGIAAMERQHLDTLNAIGSGGAGGGTGVKLPQSFTQAGPGTDCEGDKYLCGDLLSTEKHASHLYDTCIFEFQSPEVRQTLNHIQKEEQTHGQLLYDYMKVNGMYQAG